MRKEVLKFLKVKGGKISSLVAAKAMILWIQDPCTEFQL